jgi:hypothetical protein
MWRFIRTSKKKQCDVHKRYAADFDFIRFFLSEPVSEKRLQTYLNDLEFYFGLCHAVILVMDGQQ